MPLFWYMANEHEAKLLKLSSFNIPINLVRAMGFSFDITEIIKLVILLFCSGKSIEILRFSTAAKSLYFLIFYEKKDSKANKDWFLTKLQLNKS